ncbi:MAG: YitT family protein [Oscillospiraceae bacterium]|nr:YitT family protein [Oscillospiraceae bacterium]
MKAKDNIKEFIIITIADIIVGIAVFFFLVPSKLSIGSISGLAIVLSNLVPLQVSQLTMIMNVALLIVSFLLVGKDFGIKTVYTSILLPIVIGVFEVMFPNNQSLTGDQALDGIGYCLVVSIGLSMLFTRNASSGGLDIIAKLMNKFLRMDLGKAMGLSGMAVALSSALVYDTKTVVLSVFGTYFSGIVLDHFIFGSTQKKRVCIISKKHDEILQFILHQLHSGATQYHAYGTYTDKMHWEINTIVDKTEYMKLINFVTKTDPDAFMTIYAVSDMMYKPKPKN